MSQPTPVSTRVPRVLALSTRVDVRDSITLTMDNGGGGTAVVARSLLRNSNTPRVTADGRVMFFNCTEHAGRQWARSKGNGRYDSDIYYSVRTSTPDGRESWGEPVNLGPSINTSEDDAVEAISPNGGTIYFSSLAKGWVLNGGPFYSADLNDAEWRNVKGLGGGITEFFLTEPERFRIYGSAINADGDAFYFATTAHSAKSRHQIWVSYYRDSAWQYPENLGETVNSDGGSYAPFIAADGKSLYFSAIRGEGFGGDDVYLTVSADSGWVKPVNLGPEVNTAEDEAFFALPAAGDHVYLTRSRLKARGESDIVDANIQPKFMPAGVLLLTGTIVDKETGAAVNARVTIEDLKSNRVAQRVVGTGVNDRFAVVLHPGRDYGISVTAKGYGFYSMRYTIPDSVDYREIRKDIQLERIVVGNTFALNNIFFDYKSDTLRGESRPELDRLIELMRQNPMVRIMVTGHTDNVGPEAYNEALSRRRAAAVHTYLVDNGDIEASRIRTRGFGSRRPTAPNTSDEGRQRNRVVQFVIE